jgi:hypothetical protein
MNARNTRVVFGLSLTAACSVVTREPSRGYVRRAGVPVSTRLSAERVGYVAMWGEDM